MLRSLRHIKRLLSLARLLARHDALFALELAGVSPALLKCAAIGVTVQRDGRPGERLARALELGFGAIGDAVQELTGAGAQRPLHVTTTPSFAAFCCGVFIRAIQSHRWRYSLR